MTLKSLNTRYVKLIRKMAVTVGLVLATVSLLSPTLWSVGATEFNRRHAEADNSIPALQGAAAITYLKEHKLYDSLRTTLNAARIRQDDHSVVSPLFIDEQKLVASDGMVDDSFGRSVAISGSTIVVGAAGDDIGPISQGSAYVFEHQGGNWVEIQKLTASDGAAFDGFGLSVAFSGSTIVVGAPFDTINGNSLQGSAYVFNRQGGSWTETQKLTASDGERGSEFGFSVASSEATIVVGAPFGTLGAVVGQGSAYVFNREGESWTVTQKLTAGEGAFFDNFGRSVAFSGSTIVVGSPLERIDGNFGQGSAYVFKRLGGSWFEEQKLTASDGATEDNFGHSVAFGGSTIVMGSPGDNFGQGSAYIFNRQGGSWTETQKLIASGGAGDGRFGFSVTFSGSTIVVGAPIEFISDIFQGSAYVFNRQGGSWTQTQKLTASDGGRLDFFGFSVALSGSTIVVGIPNDSIGFNFFQGSVSVFEPILPDYCLPDCHPFARKSLLFVSHVRKAESNAGNSSIRARMVIVAT